MNEQFTAAGANLFSRCGRVWAIDRPDFDHLARHGLESFDDDPTPHLPKFFTGLTSSGRRGNATPSKGAVAIIPIVGVITQRGDNGYGGSKTDTIGRYLDEMLSFPNVGVIVLDINSPGGSVFGVAELADKIRQVRRTKPVIAVANSMAASAAYWLASAATKIVVTPGGQVGSIGVFSAHMDVSKMAEKAGVKISFVYAGRYKTESNAYAPLGDEARARMQVEVNSYYSQFIDSVASGRGTSASNVLRNYGQGRMLTAAEARSTGMVDSIATLDVVLDNAASGRYAANYAALLDDRLDYAQLQVEMAKTRKAREMAEIELAEVELEMERSWRP